MKVIEPSLYNRLMNIAHSEEKNTPNKDNINVTTIHKEEPTVSHKVVAPADINFEPQEIQDKSEHQYWLPVTTTATFPPADNKASRHRQSKLKSSKKSIKAKRSYRPKPVKKRQSKRKQHK